MRIGVVLVHYRTPRLAREAVSALRASEGISGAGPEIVLVDNGSDEDDLEILDGLGVPVLRPGDNLGYAGGINAGVEALRKAPQDELPDVLVLMNPDVRVAPGCLAELLRALSTGAASGAGVAGPRLLWSDGAAAAADEDASRVLLPPADPVGRRWELLRYMASVKGGGWARRARAVWRRHARRHWTATGDLPSHALSGALLAVSKGAWHRVGPFDAGYRLYFEETDWLRRAAKKGVGALHVPSARAYHGYARATRGEPRAAQWFDASEQRFRRRWYGRAFTGFLEALARRFPPAAEASDGAGTRRPEAGPDTRWIEISASSSGLPSGGLNVPHGCIEGVDPLPAFVRRRAAETTIYWRTVDVDGRESRSERVEEPAD